MLISQHKAVSKQKRPSHRESEIGRQQERQCDATHAAEGGRRDAASRGGGTQRTGAGTVEIADKVHDFMTNADVAKAEQEGQLVFYCHENEAGTAGIMEGFARISRKSSTSYVRAQTGALYNKILSERSAGRFDVDVIQLSDLAPAVDFQKKGGYEHYVSPEIVRLTRPTI